MHGRQRPVVGDAVDNGKARAAVGAIDKGVQMAPVMRIEKLLQAIVAGGDVRGDERSG